MSLADKLLEHLSKMTNDDLLKQVNVFLENQLRCNRIEKLRKLLNSPL